MKLLIDGLRDLLGIDLRSEPLTREKIRTNFVKRSICIITATAAIALAGMQSASATVVSFTNPAAFVAAVTGATDHDFQGVALPSIGFVFGNQTVDGVSFASNGNPFVIGPGFTNNYGVQFFAGQDSITNQANNPANKVSVSLAGSTAIGFFYGSYLSQNEPYSAVLNTGDVFNLATPGNAPDVNFIGFVSDAAALNHIDFTSLAGLNTLDANGNAITSFGFTFDITHFILADAKTNNVPEPNSLALIALGLTAAAIRRRILN